MLMFYRSPPISVDSTVRGIEWHNDNSMALCGPVSNDINLREDVRHSCHTQCYTGVRW